MNRGSIKGAREAERRQHSRTRLEQRPKGLRPDKIRHLSDSFGGSQENDNNRKFAKGELIAVLE